MKLWFCCVLLVAICGKALSKECKHPAFSSAIPDGRAVSINCPKHFKQVKGTPKTLRCKNGVLSPDVSKIKSFCDPIGSCKLSALWKSWFGHQPMPPTFKPGQLINIPKGMCTQRGFKISPALLKEKMQLKCQIDGRWNLNLKKPPCISKTCQVPKNHPNSWANFNSQIAQYTCEEGYKFSNGKTVKQIRCINKKWEPLKDKCKKTKGAASKKHGKGSMEKVEKTERVVAGKGKKGKIDPDSI